MLIHLDEVGASPATDAAGHRVVHFGIYLPGITFDKGYRVQVRVTQPYVIALYTCKGIPMLWHGQEFAENWSIPSWGIGRVLFSRPLHWEYFYVPMGKALVRLYRIMGTLRTQYRALRSRGAFFYYNDPFHQRDGIIAYRRTAAAEGAAPAEDVIVILNFSDQDVEVWIPWPTAGSWHELIDASETASISVPQANERQPVQVASNYGAVYRGP
jgi:1,4-alpha-glucan branching enzyme